MAWEARSGLKRSDWFDKQSEAVRLNGLGSPFGIETNQAITEVHESWLAKWPGKPVRD